VEVFVPARGGSRSRDNPSNLPRSYLHPPASETHRRGRGARPHRSPLRRVRIGKSLSVTITPGASSTALPTGLSHIPFYAASSLFTDVHRSGPVDCVHFCLRDGGSAPSVARCGFAAVHLVPANPAQAPRGRTAIAASLDPWPSTWPGGSGEKSSTSMERGRTAGVRADWRGRDPRPWGESSAPRRGRFRSGAAVIKLRARDRNQPVRSVSVADARADPVSTSEGGH
jgi:hypothetical protein